MPKLLAGWYILVVLYELFHCGAHCKESSTRSAKKNGEDWSYGVRHKYPETSLCLMSLKTKIMAGLVGVVALGTAGLLNVKGEVYQTQMLASDVEGNYVTSVHLEKRRFAPDTAYLRVGIHDYFPLTFIQELDSDYARRVKSVTITMEQILIDGQYQPRMRVTLDPPQEP
jgi:hypothetical protein